MWLKMDRGRSRSRGCPGASSDSRSHSTDSAATLRLGGPSESEAGELWPVTECALLGLQCLWLACEDPRVVCFEIPQHAVLRITIAGSSSSFVAHRLFRFFCRVAI